MFLNKITYFLYKIIDNLAFLTHKRSGLQTSDWLQTSPTNSP